MPEITRNRGFAIPIMLFASIILLLPLMSSCTTVVTEESSALAIDSDTLLPIIFSGFTLTPKPEVENPILFVAQIPIANDFTTIASTFGNHLSHPEAAGRGSDLYIRYPDGTLKNLTAAAGYGSTDPGGFQGSGAIAVREPEVHWSGTKAIFSMVVGGPTEQYDYTPHYWQMYEISGLGKDETPTITKVPNQPSEYNNVSPVYGTNGRIIFTTDRPRNGERHLFPQLDEYELAPTNTGLWSLDPADGDLMLLNHAPSGNFTPFIDSFGRVLFTQWDHLQRDQFADADNAVGTGEEEPYGTFNYADESANAAILNDRSEHFPEPRQDSPDWSSDVVGFRFNQFLPWQIREDGTDGEILNHLGRHELQDFFSRSFTTDDTLDDFFADESRQDIDSIFHVSEDPLKPGLYYGADAPEFSAHSSGQIIRLYAPPDRNADQIRIDYVTHRDTFGFEKTPDHSGRYREPLALASGSLIAVHSEETGRDVRSGNSSYRFRLRYLVQNEDGLWEAGEPLTAGINKSVSFWGPDKFHTYSGPLWELNPVEVRRRQIPQVPEAKLESPEAQVFEQSGVDVAELQTYMQNNGLALIVSRNVTQRDDQDRQQPFNLRVVLNDGTVGTQAATAAGAPYDITYLQLYQADQIRGYMGGRSDPRPGRRPLAQPLHDNRAAAANPASTGPAGSVSISADGSVAAFVPSRRAMTWQLTDKEGNPVVRERFWVSFQPGEIRVCTSCHGVNETDQNGGESSQNPPDALLQLLQRWQQSQ